MTVVALLSVLSISCCRFLDSDNSVQASGRGVRHAPGVHLQADAEQLRFAPRRPVQPVPRDIGHSLVIMVFSVGISLVLGVPAGYGLARSRFKGSGAITGWLIVAYIVPALVYIVPLYAIYRG